MKRRLSLLAGCGLLVALAAVLADRPRRTPAGQAPLSSIAQPQDVARFWADFDSASDRARALVFLSPT